MNHMKYMQKIVLLSAFFCITNQEILAASGPVGPVVGPTGPNVFGKNLVAISAMTPAQQAAAYQEFLKAAIAAVQSHDLEALSDNFVYMGASGGYDIADIDIFNHPSFSYANLTKNGFTHPEIYRIGDRLVLAPSRIEEYSTGTLVSTVAPAPTLTSTPISTTTPSPISIPKADTRDLEQIDISDMKQLIDKLSSNLPTEDTISEPATISLKPIGTISSAININNLVELEQKLSQAGYPYNQLIQTNFINKQHLLSSDTSSTDTSAHIDISPIVLSSPTTPDAEHVDIDNLVSLEKMLHNDFGYAYAKLINTDLITKQNALETFLHK